MTSNYKLKNRSSFAGDPDYNLVIYLLTEFEENFFYHERKLAMIIVKKSKIDLKFYVEVETQRNLLIFRGGFSRDYLIYETHLERTFFLAAFVTKLADYKIAVLGRVWFDHRQTFAGNFWRFFKDVHAVIAVES